MQATAFYCSLLVVLVCCITLVFPLQCYVCSSDHATKDKPCGSGKDVDASYKIDCTKASKELGGNPQLNASTWSVCRKIVTWVDYSLSDDSSYTERVLRKCGYDESKYPETCFYRGGLGGRQRVCSCKTDACNSAPKTTLTYVTILAAFTPVFIYKLFQ